MKDLRRPEEEPTWASLSRRERALAVSGMTGLGLGVVTVVAVVVLLGVLLVASASRNLIQSDGAGPLFWGAFLCLPCGLLAGIFLWPLRLLLRLPSVPGKAKRGAEMGLSAATTFLAALFVESCTPGLYVRQPWLPALLATLLVALANVVVHRFEERKKRRESRG
ncbi:hypothetical protein ACH4VR_24645 [Streptomyces sp. NPDC020883]|uniref:hypothetical protein n=1 Tax=unclassified Streptomyces TaxID=2593676 RepID=UPI0021B0CDCE|nr:hypothetical protein [Streptomyces sp. BHT-5-2]